MQIQSSPTSPTSGPATEGIQSSPSSGPERQWAPEPPSVGVSPTVLRARKEASQILFAVAVIQFVCGGTLLLMSPALGDRLEIPREAMAFAVVEWLFIWGMFAALASWARHQPLPAILVGTGLYIGINLLIFLADPQTITQGLVIKLVIIVGLIKACRTCLQVR